MEHLLDNGKRETRCVQTDTNA